MATIFNGEDIVSTCRIIVWIEALELGNRKQDYNIERNLRRIFMKVQAGCINGSRACEIESKNTVLQRIWEESESIIQVVLITVELEKVRNAQ